MSTLRTYGTIAIMIACFAIVYPRFMHPLFMRLFGAQEPTKSNIENDMYPPGYRSAPPGQKNPGVKDKDDIRRHMRPGPHPGMRAAAEMNRQQAQQGSGRGMMGVVLPMYAVGIVLYLGYTLFKVFNRGDQKNNQWGNKRNYYNRGRYAPEHDRMGFPRDFEGTQGDIKDFLRDEDQRRNLEDLLTRVDDKNVSVEEMRLLQKRLEETEVQMTRILKAMHTVQTNVDNISDNQQHDTAEGQESADKEGKVEEAKRDECKDAKTKHKDETPTHQPIVNENTQNEKDRAGAEPDNDATGDTEDDEEKDSIGGSEDDDSNEAFDVEDAADDEDDEEEEQKPDEIIPHKRESDDSEKSTARHRKVFGDKEQ